MWNIKTSGRLFIFGIFLWAIAIFFTDENDASEALNSDKEIQNPYKSKVIYQNKFLLAANNMDGISLPPDMGKQQLKFILKAGTGIGELGISTTNAKVGPGLIKKIRTGYLIADTFNNRI